MVRSAGSKPPSSSRRGHQHARAGWVLQLLKGMLKGTAGRPEFFGPSFYCCYNLLFSRLISVVLKFYFPIGGFWVFVLVFFGVLQYIICSFWFSLSGRFLTHISSGCTAVSLCPHAPLFFQSCLQSPWTWLLLTWQSWWTGCWALLSEVMGHGWASHSCQPSSAGEKAIQVLAGEAVNMRCQPPDLLLEECYLHAFIMQMAVCPTEFWN